MSSASGSDPPALKGEGPEHSDPSADTIDIFTPGGGRPIRPLERGATIGRYVILDVLGIGGMGVVYKAYDPELDRPVALKLLRGEGKEASAFRSRLVREAQALARLSHPNVIAVHDVGTYDQNVFIAMEFVEGPTLRDWLRTEARSHPAILAVVLAAGDGLAAAHGAGLVHRDFKPDNVIVGNDGRVRVLDFGLARAALGESDAAAGPAPASDAPTSDAPTRDAPTSDAATRDASASDAPTGDAATNDAPTNNPPVAPVPVPEPVESPSRRDLVSQVMALSPLPSAATAVTAVTTTPSRMTIGRLTRLDEPITQRGSIVGTPRYMAPEQHTGDSVDERADQFSFCVTLYEALYGGLPFGGNTMPELKNNVVAGRVSEAPPGTHVPRWLRSALLRGLLPNRAARHSSMSALLTVLRADPSVVRARRLRWTGALTLVGLIAVGWRLQHRAEARLCAGGAAKLAGIWDDPRRAALRKTFLGSGKSYAATVLGTVEHAFDTYAQRWVAMHNDACVATQIRGEQSQELLDLRMACLNDRLTQLKTLSDLDIGGDPAVVEHAAQAAESLPTLDGCADAAALRAPIAPPRDSATTRRAADIRQRLSRANALKLAGKYGDGVTVASAALTDATGLHYAPVEAEAKYALGVLQWQVGNADASWRSLRHAYADALASRHEQIQANAAIDLIFVIGRNNKYDEAERWSEVAEANAQRMRNDELLGRFYTARADLYRIRGRFAEGVADAQRGIDLLRRVFGPDDQRVALSYRGLAILFSLVGRNLEALTPARHAIAISERLLGPEHPAMAELHNSLGIIYGELGEHELALAEYQRAVSILLNAGIGPERPEVALYYSNIAGRLQSMARLAEAESYVRRGLAIEVARKPQPLAYNLSYLWENLASIKIDMKQPAEALEAAQKAVAISEKMGIGSAGVFPLYALAESYRMLHDYDKATPIFERALKLGEPALGADHSDLAKLHLGLGRIYFDRHQLARARAELGRALAIREAHPGDGIELADVRFRLAQTLMAADPNARDQALAVADKAHDAYAKMKWLLPDALPEVNAWLARYR
jgi:serine/threonine protein kinase/tetratricopeptide (TPR) repeat protein